MSTAEPHPTEVLVVKRHVRPMPEVNRVEEHSKVEDKLEERATRREELLNAQQTIEHIHRRAKRHVDKPREDNSKITIVALEAKVKAYKEQAFDPDERRREARAQIEESQRQVFVLDVQLKDMNDRSPPIFTAPDKKKIAESLEAVHQVRDTLLAVLNDASSHVQQYLSDVGSLRAAVSDHGIEDNIWNALSQSAEMNQVGINALRIMSEMALHDLTSNIHRNPTAVKRRLPGSITSFGQSAKGADS
ncbi:hypothetical protein QFC20_006649 [Naganishia adeliensis]|uniref:Uncharacterized protein n=1 Tax=Naganishia adeliensis TaxID=92952 RepID=A0ACC2V9T8_9TREE|nr:hypothetical protein QFC20_006649 [Naganishia adeliensis]